jgi:hypothetical protein
MLVIEEELLLEALLRALCAVKFDRSPESDTVRELEGSPLVASIMEEADSNMAGDARGRGAPPA